MNKEQQNPFKICGDYLNQPRTVYKINKHWQEKIHKTLDLINETIIKINNEENIDDFNFKPIEESINFLTAVTAEMIVDTKLKDFIHAYVFLCHNINENTFKYPAVARKIRYLQRFTEDSLTYSETQNLLRNISTRLSKRKFSTPSFRLSQHYYSLLKEE